MVSQSNTIIIIISHNQWMSTVPINYSIFLILTASPSIHHSYYNARNVICMNSAQWLYLPTLNSTATPKTHQVVKHPLFAYFTFN